LGNLYLDVLKNKTKALFSKRIAFSSVIFSSQVSKKASIKHNSRFYSSNIGDYSYVARNCLVQNTIIGRFCSISDYCNIGLPSHPLSYVSSSPVFLKGKNNLKINFNEFGFEDCKKTWIGNDVWIGANVMIKSGLTIGDGAVIGAGAVVTHDIPPYEIWAGNPAKLIRKRFDDETIKKLLEIKWWEWSGEKITRNANLFDNPKNLIKNKNV